MVASPVSHFIDSSRPRKVVGTSHFNNKRPPNGHTHPILTSSIKSLTPEACSRSSLNTGKPIRARAKVTQPTSAAPPRAQSSPCPELKSTSDNRPVSVQRITAKVTTLNPLDRFHVSSPGVPHQLPNCSSSDKSSASQSSKAILHRSLHSDRHQASQIKSPPHVTQRSKGTRSRANTSSDRCPSNSDTFSSLSSSSAQACEIEILPGSETLTLVPSSHAHSLQLISPAHTAPDTARKEESLEVPHHHRLLSSLLAHPIHSYDLTPSSTLASPVNLRPLSADSSDSSPVSGDWTKADGCSSGSSVHEQEKQDHETLGQCELGEVKEEEARVNRKILDLEISNASLLAINARLERTKLKQANEIRELRKKMRERSMGHHASIPVTLDDGSSAAEESEAEEGEKIESLMKVDQRFAEAIGILEGLIGRAKQALVSVPGDLGSKKVLNRMEIRDDGDDDEDDEEEEEDLEADVDIPITSSHLPSSNPLPTPPPLSPVGLPSSVNHLRTPSSVSIKDMPPPRLGSPSKSLIPQLTTNSRHGPKLSVKALASHFDS